MEKQLSLSREDKQEKPLHSQRRFLLTREERPPQRSLEVEFMSVCRSMENYWYGKIRELGEKVGFNFNLCKVCFLVCFLLWYE